MAAGFDPFAQFPAEFIATTVRDAGEVFPAVRVRFGSPIGRLVGAALASDQGESPYANAGTGAAFAGSAAGTGAGLDAGGGLLVSVPGQEEDVFAQLEAEMVSDRLEAAQALRRLETRETVAGLFDTTQQRGVFGFSRGVVVDATIGASEAQDVLEWLNRMYVTMRTAELAVAGAAPVVGQSQSAAHLLDLPEDETDAAAGHATDGGPDEGETPPMGVMALVFATLVSMLQEALDSLES